MPNSSKEFNNLVQRARDGDEDALAALARQYEPELRIVARVRLGSALRPHLDSVDLVQSVHRSLMVGIRNNKFDISSPENLIALALTMVRRKVARKWRKLRRQQRLSLGPNQGEALADVLSSLQSPHSDPEKAHQVNEAMQQVCRELSAQDQQLLRLRLDGFSTAEAARELGQDPDVMRVRLSRLRRQLRDSGILREWV